MNFSETGAEHFENSDFVGGAETIFNSTDGFEAAVAVTFEIKHDVDEVLEDFGAGEGAVFSDVTDDNDGGVGSFGGANNEIATIGDLRDGARSAGDFVHSESLDGIDNDEVEFGAFDSFGNVVTRGAGSETEFVASGTEAFGAEFDLAGGFFAGDVENIVGFGDFGADLHEKCRFANARLTS